MFKLAHQSSKRARLRRVTFKYTTNINAIAFPPKKKIFQSTETKKTRNSKDANTENHAIAGIDQDKSFHLLNNIPAVETELLENPETTRTEIDNEINQDVPRIKVEGAAKKIGLDESESQYGAMRELGVCEELCLQCDSLGWTNPTLIQQKAIPFALQGRDIIGLAETGSGKTAAFAIPILHRLLDTPQHKGVYALILAPTRELSLQISQQFRALGTTICLKVSCIYGGVDMVSQAMELAKKPHIVIATPGRLLDHLQNTKGFHLSTIKFLVLDEADRMLSLDFEEPLNLLFEILPVKRQTLLFSATMTERVSKLQKASLKNPHKAYVSEKYDTVKNLVQNMKLVPFQFKLTYIVALMKHLQHYAAMIFINTCLDAQKAALCLKHMGLPAICLHGRMSQYQRLAALNAFQSITTEVGSRGLDIPHVDVVVNYDVPHSSKDYIHRVGRTARAGRSGRSITIVTPYDLEAFQNIELATKKRMEPYNEMGDDFWKEQHAEVEEARLLSEKQMREQQDSQSKIKTNRPSQFFGKKKKFAERR